MVFDQTMHDRAVRRLELELDLRQAVGRGEFEVYYQPIISLSDHQLARFEALVRWRHPSKGLISLVEFIPVAEETAMKQMQIRLLLDDFGTGYSSLSYLQ